MAQIKIKTDKKAYTLGETIVGEVIIYVQKAGQCKSLSLQHYWLTHGKGDKETRIVRTINLFQGSWQPGVKRYPFKLPLDTIIPPSFKGRIITVEHLLKVTADTSWLSKLTCEVPVVTSQSQKNVFVKTASDTLNEQSPAWHYLLPMIMGFLIGGGIIGFASRPLTESTMIICLVALVFGCWGSYMTFLSNKLKRLGEFEARIKPAQDKKSIDISLEFDTNATLSLLHIDATLVLFEYAEHIIGTTTHRYDNIVRLNTKRLCAAKRLPKDEFTTVNTIIELPEHLIPNFEQETNSITWQIHYEIRTTKFLHTFKQDIAVISRP